MGADSATGLVVGTGDFVYDVFRPWGVLPAGWTFGPVSHVAVDSKDRVYFSRIRSLASPCTRRTARCWPAAGP